MDTPYKLIDAFEWVEIDLTNDEQLNRVIHYLPLSRKRVLSTKG